MTSLSLKQLKSKYKLRQFMRGKVEFHAPFGVFLDIDDSSVKGLIKIPDFLDEGEMREDMYPEIGTMVGAVVVGYQESNCREAYLSAKPSVLHQAFVPLKTNVLNV